MTSEISIQSVLNMFEQEYGVFLSKVQGKQIIFEGEIGEGEPIVVVMPKSKIYARGHGWVDFTKRQLDLFSHYSKTIAVFRLEGGVTHYVDFKSLIPLLTTECMKENEREGYHWKLDVWPNKLVIKGSDGELNIESNNSKLIGEII